MSDQTPFWVGLSKVQGIGPVRMRRLLDYFGDAETTWRATPGDLRDAGLESKLIEALAETRRTINLDREMERLHAAGARALTWASDDYPERLREIDDAPPVLYILGDFAPTDTWAVAVVGTRRATHYGREVTARLASELAQAGVIVVSGLPASTVSAVLTKTGSVKLPVASHTFARYILAS